ncbi:DNA binding methylated-DNA--cysteine S-methyltransferase [Trichodelitschia bisporula]|uniref:Methylated-DNA--protein-cysteine methyltransferase n=1 Tax=Trichodelitschia bisporula TaxID=703511 RepID=A0A6G1HTW1_9PEZI|nr:DNA binding methylated-DNA--cysteine S-methyltransferase [Trichodelitschia bisporula]
MEVTAIEVPADPLDYTTLPLPSINPKTNKPVSAYQARVWALLLQIPAGRIASYAALSRALQSSPRAVGGACRTNPFAPGVPCHRVISSTGYIGGFQGDWQKAPSGVNCAKKQQLLREEGVLFDEAGMLMDKTQWWDDFRV